MIHNKQTLQTAEESRCCKVSLPEDERRRVNTRVIKEKNNKAVDGTPPSTRVPRAVSSGLLLIESFLWRAGSVCPRQTLPPLGSAPLGGAASRLLTNITGAHLREMRR